MKKLMIAAAVVCAAALSQAATFDWITSAKAYGPDADPTKLTAGYYGPGTKTSQYMSKFTPAANWLADITISLLDSKGAVVSSSTTENTAVGFSSNKAAGTGINNATFNLPAAGADAITYAIDIVLKGTMKDGSGNDTFYLTSDTIHWEQEFSDTSAPQFTVGAPAGWTVEAASVPEPTSGLLLLLGVAGLALRRRRA